MSSDSGGGPSTICVLAESSDHYELGKESMIDSRCAGLSSRNRQGKRPRNPAAR